MAVDGKNASGRLAAAAVLWLLVAIFANQDYVYCQETQQEFDQRSQQQQQQQQFQPPQQQPQPSPSTQQFSPQFPQLLPQQQQQQQQFSPQQQHFSPKLSQLPQQQQQLLLPIQQPLLPPKLPQDGNGPNGIMGQMNNMGNDMQPNMNKLPGQSMNNDFGAKNGIPKKQQQQSLINVGAPLDMLGGGLAPSFSGGPPQGPNFDETNLSQGITNNNQPSGQNQWRPPLHFNEQMQGTINNLQQKYPEQNLHPRPMMSVPPHNMQYQLNHHLLAMPNMNQPIQSQIPKPNQPQSYYSSNTDNIVPGSTKPFVGYPEQSNMNLGDMMQPIKMFTNLIPENPLDFVQKPVGMMFNSVSKLGEYGGGVKEGVSNVLKDVVKKIFDQSQSGVNRVLNMGLSGSNAAFEVGRRIFLPDSSGQQVRNSKDPQVVDSSVRPNSPENEFLWSGSSNPINPPQPIYQYGPG